MERCVEVIFSPKPNDSIFTSLCDARAYLAKGHNVKVRISDLVRLFKPEEISEFEELHKIMTGGK